MAGLTSVVESGEVARSSRHINELTRLVIGSAIKVHRRLGPGLLESAYEACLAHELKALGLHVERQKPVPLIYEGVKLDCGFRADLIVDGRLVVELKCKDMLHPVDYSQYCLICGCSD